MPLTFEGMSLEAIIVVFLWGIIFGAGFALGGWIIGKFTGHRAAKT